VTRSPSWRRWAKPFAEDSGAKGKDGEPTRARTFSSESQDEAASKEKRQFRGAYSTPDPAGTKPRIRRLIRDTQMHMALEELQWRTGTLKLIFRGVRYMYISHRNPEVRGTPAQAI